jgi:hypothetical protein
MRLLGNPERARIQNRLPIALSAMDGNFSAGTVRRKWPCSGSGRIDAPMVTVASVLLMLCAQSGPAAARHPSPDPWSDLFGVSRQKARRAALRAPAQASVPLPKPRPADAPAAGLDAAVGGNRTPGPSDKPDEPVAAAPQPSACRRALTEAIAIAPSIPDIHGAGGCGGVDLVRLEVVVLPDKRQVSVKPAAILRCAMASAIADWIRTDIAPLAAGVGSAISSLDNFDSFECRGRNRVSGAELSEHGRANALDVRALQLASGQSISLTDPTVSRELRESVLHSVCARFSTVLGPGSDGYHEDHIHLDLMERRSNYKICKWNIWDSLPKIAPLLPAPRPDQAPPREALPPNPTPRNETLPIRIHAVSKKAPVNRRF